MGVHVIDVSRWQGTIDWHRVKDSGVRGAWIKVGGSDGGLYSDSRAAANLAGAAAAHLPHGTYYFAVPRWNDARAQAQHAVSIRHGEGDLWPVLDLEDNRHGLNHDQLDTWVTDFCHEIHALIVRESIWYGGKGTGVGYSNRPPRCPIWIANYGDGKTAGTRPPPWSPGLPPAWQTYDAWQFNSITMIPGITENTVDQNVVTDAFWNQMMAGDDTRPAPPAPVLEDTDMANKAVFCPDHTGGVGWRALDINGRRHREGYTTGDDLDVDLLTGIVDGRVELRGGQADRFLANYSEMPIPGPWLVTCAADTTWAREVAGLAAGESGRFFLVPNRYLVRIHDDAQWNSDLFVGTPDRGVVPEPFLFNQPLLPWAVRAADVAAVVAAINAALDDVEVDATLTPEDVQAIAERVVAQLGSALAPSSP